jgi:site-specific recombinase XerD
MFEQLLSSATALRRHQDGPFAAERERYLQHCSDSGATYWSLRIKSMTRFGIHRLVTRYAEMASEKIPSMQAKRISPHNIRHTTAVHMLRGGVDINTIRAWLGHVSLDTTNIYAEVDLEMKAKALGKRRTNQVPQVQRHSAHCCSRYADFARLLP